MAVGSRGVLATAIAVGDGAAEITAGAGKACALEGLGHQFGAQMRGGGPAEDAAGVQVHDGGQIEPALARGDVGNVTDPNLVRRGGGWALEQEVGGWMGGGICLGGAGNEGAFMQGLEAELTHESGDALPGNAEALLPCELGAQAWGAVGLAAGRKGGGNLWTQALVLAVAVAFGFAQVGVVAAAAHAKGFTEFVDLIVCVVHLGDHFKGLRASCETMAIAFFKMSR